MKVLPVFAASSIVLGLIYFGVLFYIGSLPIKNNDPDKCVTYSQKYRDNVCDGIGMADEIRLVAGKCTRDYLTLCSHLDSCSVVKMRNTCQWDNNPSFQFCKKIYSPLKIFRSCIG